MIEFFLGLLDILEGAARQQLPAVMQPVGSKPQPPCLGSNRQRLHKVIR